MHPIAPAVQGSALAQQFTVVRHRSTAICDGLSGEDCALQSWKAPPQRRQVDGRWLEFTRHGERPLVGKAPVCHLTFYEADAYACFAGFTASADAVGEYNGKFMVNQYVLRGGSCLSSPGHPRCSYRNFFPASARWQMTGLRLARSNP
jgi:formylglycine-generating enzyme required for sulfatase activity